MKIPVPTGWGFFMPSNRADPRTLAKPGEQASTPAQTFPQ